MSSNSKFLTRGCSGSKIFPLSQLSQEDLFIDSRNISTLLSQTNLQNDYLYETKGEYIGN